MQILTLTKSKVLICAFLILAGCVFAEVETAEIENPVIGSIETVGNVTITRAKILATVRARIGEVFDKDIADEDINRLAKIEGVEYTYYNTEIVDNQIKLTYVVVEKNLVRVIEFVGNDEIKSKKLINKIGFKRGDYLDVFIARKGAQEIREYYNGKGYPTTKVEVEREGLLSGTVKYIIEEGPRTKINTITIEGNDAISKSDIKGAIKTKKKRFLFWPAYYEESKYSMDSDRITEEYHDKGYLDVKVTAELTFDEDQEEADVKFKIEEGPQYFVENISITGNTFFEESELYDDMKLDTGKYYNEERALFDAKQITSNYLEQGFLDVKIEEKREYVGVGKVDVSYDVTPGDRYKIGQINVSGNRNIHERSILNLMDEEGFTPGEWYNGDIARGDGKGELEKTLQRIVLSSTAIIQPAGEKDGIKDANISLVEAKTGDINFGGGVGSNSGAFGTIMLRQRNFDITNLPTSLGELFSSKAFTGAGQQFTAAWYPGTEQTSFGIDFVDPYIHDMPMSFSMGASSFERWQEASDEKRTRIYMGVEKRYKNRWRRGTSVRYEQTSISDLDADAPQEIIDVKGSNDVFGFKFNIRKDTTDSRFTPSEGYHFNASYEQMFGDFNFGVISATQRWYRTLHEDLAERKIVLETKLHASSTVGDAPFYDKFYGGGSKSIRGFDFRGVSPRGINPLTGTRGDVPIGSDWIVTGNSELAIPLTSEVFSWLFFVDSGLVETGGVRASVGTGIQILLPQWFGPVPMRFEYAKPFMKDDDDDLQSFSFSVGALF